MKTNFACRLVSFLSSLSILLQSFAPFAAITPQPIFAGEHLTNAITYSNSKGVFHFELNNKEAGVTTGSVSYSLSYKNELTGQLENVNGTADLSESNFTRDIDAATCSSGGVCVKHAVSQGILKAKIDSANWFDSQWFKVENGTLVVKNQYSTGSVSDLSIDEQNWLSDGEGVAPTIVPTVEPTATPTEEPTIAPTEVPTPTTTIIPSTVPQLGDEEVQVKVVKLDGSYADPNLVPATWTDKADYAPTEKVVVSGKNFTPNYEYTIVISSTDDPAVTHTDTFTALADGTFSYEYQLDGNYRPNYKVEVKDMSDTVVATTTFLDHFLMSVLINGTDITTHSRNVTLNISWATFPIFDSNPTVARYVNDLSPYGSCSDLGEGIWSAWEPIATLKSWTLASGGNGLRKVCVQTAHGTVNSPTDSLTAGNVIIYDDNTPPTISPSITGTVGVNGWYTSDVDVSWIVTDESSVSLTGCDVSHITSDTSGTVLTCKATSAGGTTAKSVTIKRDATKPTITYTGRTAANSSGWNTSDVTVNWSCSDLMSGPVSATVSKIVSTEGSNLSSMGTCADNAGNTIDDTQSEINIDKTPPPVPTLNSPANGVSINTSGLVMRWDSVTDLYNNPVTYNYRSFWPGSGTGTLYVGTNNFINAPNTPDNIYTWQVQACDSLGLCSDWATSWTVTVDNKAPTGTVAYSTDLPTNGDVIATLSTPEPVTITSIGGSTHTFTDNGTFVFNFHDEAGNMGSETATVANIDKEAPNAPTLVSPTNNQYVTTHNFQFSWNSVTDLNTPITYEWESSYGTGTNGEGLFSSRLAYHSSSSTFLNSPGTPDNVYYWHVRAIDGAGNKSAWSQTWKVTVDTIKPTTPVINAPLAGQHFKTTPILNKWNVITDASGIKQYIVEYIYADGHTFTGAPYRYTTTNYRNHSPGTTEQGGVTIRVQAEDNAGNVSDWSNPVQYFYDATAPVITDIADINVGTDLGSDHAIVSYTLTATDKVDGSVAVNCSPTSGSTFALETTTVTCTASDLAGNTATKTFKVTVSDNEAPTVAGTPSTATPTKNNKPTWSWSTATDNVGVDHYVFYWDKISGGETYHSGNITTLSFTHNDALPEGTWYGKVKAVDAAGKSSMSGIGEVVIDTTKPTSVISSPDNGGTNSIIYISKWDGSVLGTASDSLSDVNRVVLSIKRGSDDNYWDGSAWVTGETRVTASGSVNWSYALSSPSEDAYQIVSHAIDNAGNVEDSYRLTVVLDKTIPEVAISLNPTVADAANGWYKTQPEITLTGKDTYLDGVQYQWDSQSGTWTDYSGPFKPGTERAHVLYYRAHDKANNFSGVGIKNIAWNQTTLKNGPLNVNVSPNPTSETTSKVKWEAAVSDTIGIDRYEVQWKMKNGSGNTYTKSVGNDVREYTVDNLTEGVWEVKVTAFDASGNSMSASADLTVDRTGPAAPTLSVLGTTAGSVSLSWSKINEANNYIIWYGTVPGSYQYGAKVGDTQSYTVQGLGAGSYYFIVRAVDPSGNQSGNSNEVSTGAIAGAPGVAANTPAQGFSQNVLGANTLTPTPVPTGSVLGAAIAKKGYWWWPWILLLLLPIGWFGYKKWKNRHNASIS